MSGRSTSGVAVACAGFLAAVLWMDLMFDVQVLRHGSLELPEAVLASIAAYYRRVTTDASPLGYLIGVVMAVTVVSVSAQAIRAPGPPWRRLVPVVLLVGPILLAAARVFPNAVRLGARLGSPAGQSALARAICRDHLVCLVCVGGFLAIQLGREAAVDR